MILNYIKKNYHIATFILLVSSIFIGFFFDENITIGPKLDFAHAMKQVLQFENDFSYTFFNYDKIEHPTRISPIFITFIYFFKQISPNLDILRFGFVLLMLFNQIFFYKCLKLLFNIDNKINKKNLFLISCIIYLSPSFRANIIWPESAMLGLLLFLISIYFFLKFKNHKNIKFALLNIFFLALASYIRPSFCLFSIYFLYQFLKYTEKKRLIRNTSIFIGFNLVLAFPAFYYVFILDVFFIKVGGLSFNLFNKLLIISSIIVFHCLPLLLYKRFNLGFDKKKDLILITLIILLVYFSFSNFNYELRHSGGGIILHASNFIFGNNLIFFILSPIFLFFVFKLALFKNFDNAIIIILLFFIAPQYHIFHKYYDPLIIILCFLILNLEIKKDFFNTKKYIYSCYAFYLIYYSINLSNYILNL